MMKIWLNNRLHLVDDELGVYIDKLEADRMKLQLQISNATKMLRTINDALKRLTEKVKAERLAGHTREELRDMPND